MQATERALEPIQNECLPSLADSLAAHVAIEAKTLRRQRR